VADKQHAKMARANASFRLDFIHFFPRTTLVI
jgi:hypothetical protein